MREEDTVCVGSDGLQYCKVCGEAKEAFFPEGGLYGDEETFQAMCL